MVVLFNIGGFLCHYPFLPDLFRQAYILYASPYLQTGNANMANRSRKTTNRQAILSAIVFIPLRHFRFAQTEEEFPLCLIYNDAYGLKLVN